MGLTTGDHRPHHGRTPPQSSEMPGGGDGGGCPRGGKGACPGGLPGGGNGAGAREGNAPTGTPPGPSPRPPAPDPSLAPPWDRGSKATHWPGSLVAPGREGGNREAASLGRTWSPALPPTPHAAPTPGSGSRGGDALGGAWVGPSEAHCAAPCGCTPAASTWVRDDRRATPARAPVPPPPPCSGRTGDPGGCRVATPGAVGDPGPEEGPRMAVRTVRPMVRLRAAARRRRTARTFWICWQPRHMRPRRKMKPPMTREEYPAHSSTPRLMPSLNGTTAVPLPEDMMGQLKRRV